MDGAEHVGRILRGVRVSRIFSPPVCIGGRWIVAGCGVLLGAVRPESRIRRRSRNDRHRRVWSDVLLVGVCAQQSSARNDRARMARYFQRSDARAAPTFPCAVIFSARSCDRAPRGERKVVEKICIFFLTLYARNSIHSLTAAFYVADFDVDIEKGE